MKSNLWLMLAVLIIIFGSAGMTTAQVCGDDVPEAPEECDDGGNENGDGCSSTCLFELSPAPGHFVSQIGGLPQTDTICTSENSGTLPGCCGVIPNPLLSPMPGRIVYFNADGNADSSVIFQTSAANEKITIRPGTTVATLNVNGQAKFDDLTVVGTLNVMDFLDVLDEDNLVIVKNTFNADSIRTNDIGDIPCDGDGDGNFFGEICVQNDLVVSDDLYLKGISQDLDGAVGAWIGSGYGGGEFGRIGAHQSSIRFKDKIELLEDDFANILELEPKTFVYKEARDKSFGYIAEDLDEIGLEKLVIYNEEGLPDSIAYDKINMYLLEVLREQEKTLDELERLICDDNPEAEVCNGN